MPEHAYEGGNLLAREVNQYYPWQAHFLPTDQTRIPPSDLCFWLLLLAAPVVLSRLADRRLRWCAVAVAALLPAAWGQTDSLSARLTKSIAPYSRGIDARGAPKGRQMVQYTIPYKRLQNRTPDGKAWAAEGEHDPGYVGWGALPYLMPGMYVVELPGLKRLLGCPFFMKSPFTTGSGDS